MALLQVIADMLQVPLRLRSSSRGASFRAQHLLETGVHFFLCNELAAVGLGDTFAHGGPEAGFFLKQAQRGVLHQAFRSVPDLLAICASCASCSVVKRTSMPLKIREERLRSNSHTGSEVGWKLLPKKLLNRLAHPLEKA